MRPVRTVAFAVKQEKYCQRRSAWSSSLFCFILTKKKKNANDRKASKQVTEATKK